MKMYCKQRAFTVANICIKRNYVSNRFVKYCRKYINDTSDKQMAANILRQASINNII